MNLMRSLDLNSWSSTNLSWSFPTRYHQAHTQIKHNPATYIVKNSAVGKSVRGIPGGNADIIRDYSIAITKIAALSNRSLKPYNIR